MGVVANLKGPKGDKGNDGAPGSVWYNGSGAPADTLGSDKDYYLDNDSGNVYEKVAGTWA